MAYGDFRVPSQFEKSIQIMQNEPLTNHRKGMAAQRRTGGGDQVRTICFFGLIHQGVNKSTNVKTMLGRSPTRHWTSGVVSNGGVTLTKDDDEHEHFADIDKDVEAQRCIQW